MTCDACENKWITHCVYCRVTLCQYHLHVTPHGLQVCAFCSLAPPNDDGK